MLILIVDDDAEYGELLQRRLERQGYRAEYFRGPFGTLNEVTRRSPDLLIMDVNMPGLSGDALTTLIGKSGASGRRPMVLLTSGMEESELATLASRAGADDWISKTASRDELLAKISALVARRALESE